MCGLALSLFQNLNINLFETWLSIDGHVFSGRQRMSLLFSPTSLGSLSLRNRVVMSPMQQYRGDAHGRATPFHVHHYARPARGGVGLVIVESTTVAREGRLFPDDIGIFDDGHVEPLRTVVDAVHAEGAAIGIQLVHGGRKAQPPSGSRLLAPSAIAFEEELGVPNEATEDDIGLIVRQFADGARRAVEAGFDAIEIHAAHGYLIHQFLSPLTNKRQNSYGGSFEKRGKLLRDIFTVVRNVVGKDYPLLVRVSATDFANGGLTPIEVANHLKPLIPLGLAAVDVSSGGLIQRASFDNGPEFQVPFAAEIRQALGIPAIAVGLIRNAERAEAILQSKQADFIAFGRPLLERPDYAHDLRRKLDGAQLRQSVPS
jgi:NADPH2 dehydrogenase